MKVIDRLAGWLGYTRPPTLSRGPVRRLARDFDAGDSSRLTTDFPGHTVSIDTNLVRRLRVMRGRSRALCQNEPYARRYLRLIEKNIAGAAGVQLSILGSDDKSKGHRLTKEEAAQIEKLWDQWRCSNWACTDRRHTWAQAQRKALRTACTDGESFTRIIADPGNPWIVSLSWYASDQFDEQLNSATAGGGEIRMAVEFDAQGRRIAYHPFKRNPVDYLPGAYRAGQGERQRIDASQMVHWFVEDFMGQTRGIPWLFSGITRVNMLGGYEESELVASRVAAAKMGFLVMPEGMEYRGDGQDAAGNTITEAQPGTFEEVPFGTELKSFDPQHPNANFAAFSKCMLRGIAASGDVSYHTLSGDLESVNYSSARVGLLDERDGYALLQDEFISGFCMPVFRAWLMAQANLGKIALTLEEAVTFNEVLWRPRRWAWIDPQKEIAAAAQAVALRVGSRTRVVSESGGQFEQVLAELCAEEAAIKECGLTPMGEVANVLQVGVSKSPKKAPKEDDVGADPEEEGATIAEEVAPARNGHLRRARFKRG